MTEDEARLLAERVRWHAANPSSYDLGMFRLDGVDVVHDPDDGYGVEVRWQQGSAHDAYLHVERQYDLESWVGEGEVSVERMASDIYMFGLVEPHGDPTAAPRRSIPPSTDVFYSRPIDE